MQDCRLLLLVGSRHPVLSLFNHKKHGHQMRSGMVQMSHLPQALNDKISAEVDLQDLIHKISTKIWSLNDFRFWRLLRHVRRVCFGKNGQARLVSDILRPVAKWNEQCSVRSHVHAYWCVVKHTTMMGRDETLLSAKHTHDNSHDSPFGTCDRLT